ncbi:hypothetical protein RV11_GL003258 [Enterococcus phoeniculicola]|jgi:hypothetical protein|uniref:HTH tetR-type domain-containing protein n=1 Tax=Enterococcus phoeniculicola ATCC BAA-412 TaxID=1158610 RepID=R3U5S2_9ENTE|nr:TetR/AcrR family transcriptional regulator [Enterococcus phoeniculicola]EOL48763.1 hypothetical protein UC3_00314 [Enterococcus phoeniculicola ATCC BAA-412]EOT72609.1 hypothetical protein I589_02878 [Enterococcus phoeniculicola ATCC BAA-412]OJG71883.1 hypothetical protein RV11_GL003258 [Enterococcus phoeniculicola]
MVRTKKIFREQLLEGAYQLVVDEGFKHFHARKVAKVISCSTQPIYREFDNLTTFKAATSEYIIQTVEQFLSDKERHDLSSFSEVLCQYADKHPDEFERFFLVDETCKPLMKELINVHFNHLVISLPAYQTISSEQLDQLFDLFWFYTLGKAAQRAHTVTEEEDLHSTLDELSKLYIQKIAV